MKHFTSFIAFLCFAQFMAAQNVAMDTSFGQHGYIHTALLTPYFSHHSIIDLTPDNDILVTGQKISDANGLLLCKYSLEGDSLQAYNFPNELVEPPSISSVKCLPDGSFLITDYQKGKGLRRINPDGSLDQQFGTNGSASLFYNSIEDIFISRDSQILVTGQHHTDEDGELRGAYLIAYDMEGHLDSTFGDHGRFRYSNNYFDFLFKILQQADGKILLAGCTMVPSDPGFNTLMRLLPNGSLDSTFGVNGVVLEQLSMGGENYGMALQADQKIVVCGYDQGFADATIMRYLPDGSLDETFGNKGVVKLPMTSQATDLIIRPNGNILVFCSIPNGIYQTALFQLLPTGKLDPDFGNTGVFYNPLTHFSPPMKMKLVDDHKLFVTGANIHSTPNGTVSNLRLQAYILDLNVGVVSPQHKAKFLTYPNPVQEQFDIRFELETKEELQFDVYDLSGKHLQTVVPKTSFEAGSHTTAISLPAGLPAGTYILMLSSAGKPMTSVQLMKI